MQEFTEDVSLVFRDINDGIVAENKIKVRKSEDCESKSCDNFEERTKEQILYEGSMIRIRLGETRARFIGHWR